MLWLLLVSSLFAGCIDGEIISVLDMTPENGLPQTLTFYVKRGQENVKLLLQENNQERQSKQSLVSKSYKDYLHDGSFEVSLTKQNSGGYLRTLTGTFKLNGEPVQIKPVMESRTQGNPWTPYVLLTNEETKLKSVPGSNSEDNLLERYLLAQRAEKMRSRKPARQFSYGLMPFPLPTQVTVDFFATEEQSDSSEMTSPWSTDATLSSDMTSEPSYLSEGTTLEYPIEKRRRCKDSFSQCKKWLNDIYQNNLKNFCGRDMFESWCCDTCKDWDVAPVQCKDDLSDCRETLQDVYHNDYDAFCALWDDSCCATCSRKPEGNCVDKGHLGLTCQKLLDWAVHGNMEKMCIHYKRECCAMCSGNGSHDL